MMHEKNNFVAVLMGSDSDWPILQHTVEVLHSFNIPCEVRVSSAHRTPQATTDYIVDAEQRGCQVFIAAAGMAAHLAGCVAAWTTRPVIGVPLEAGSLRGMDSLLSTVQMPSGVPVACVAVGKAGAQNAGYLAAQILALHHQDLAQSLCENREAMRARIGEKNKMLQDSLLSG